MKTPLPSAEDYAAERAQARPLDVVDLQAMQRAVTDAYHNQVVLDVNRECLRLAVFEGEYRWHRHPDTDELFLVVDGELRIDFADGTEAVLRRWQCLVVPAGTVHRTRAVGRTVNLTLERQGAAVEFLDDAPNLARE
jgi:mannose-6-phosphate isomerase-like protein (cupin superfamily)